MSSLMKALPIVASMLGDKLGVKVVVGSSDTASTNGDTIFLPPMPVEDEGSLYPLISGFIDHEAAHIRHTDLGILKQKKLAPIEKYLWNAIEDWRVEHEIIKRYPGCREHFLYLIRRFFLKEKIEGKAGENDSPAFSVLNYVLLTLRSWDVPELSAQCEQEANVIHQHWPGLCLSIDALMNDIPSKCHSSQDTLIFARKIVRLIKQEAQAIPEKADSPVQSPSANPSDQPQQSQPLDQKGEKNTLHELLQTTEDELPTPMDKRLAAMISERCQAESNNGNGICVAMEGKLTTDELPPAVIMEAQAVSRALRTKLHGLLQAQVLRRSCPSHHGKICGSSLYKIAVQNPRLFMKTESAFKIDTAVHILLDVSGSMNGCITLACGSCYAVSLALSAIPGISVGVSAFPADYDSQGPTVYPLLRHGERLVNSFGLEAHGGTPMTEALWWVVRQISVLPEHRKIVLLVTDGVPDNTDTAQKTISAIQGMGVEVAGIGIDTPILASLLPHSENITDIRDLAPAMFRLLQQSLLKNRR